MLTTTTRQERNQMLIEEMDKLSIRFAVSHRQMYDIYVAKLMKERREEVAYIIKRYQDGDRVLDIAKKCKFYNNNVAIYSMLKKRNIKRSRKRFNLTVELAAQIVADYQAGIRPIKIVQTYNLPHSQTIYLALSRAGIKANQRKNLSRETMLDIGRHYTEGVQMELIQKKFSLSVKGIHSILDRLGIARETREVRQEKRSQKMHLTLP